MDALIWMTVMTSVLGLGHFYVYRRLVADASLSKPIRTLAAIFLGCLLLLLPTTFLLVRTIPRSYLTVPSFLAFGWMGLLSTWFSLLVLAAGAQKKPEGPRDRRRRPATTPRARASARRRCGSRRCRFDGDRSRRRCVRIHQASARHHALQAAAGLRRVQDRSGFGYSRRADHRSRFRGVDGRGCNEEGADLIAITGDLVDGTVEQLRDQTAPLARLVAKEGVYFVTGNHEYYSGADDWVTEVERLGIQVLRNRRVVLRRDDAAIDVAGVTDHRAGRYGDGPDFDAALAGRDPTRELVLHAHQPAALEEAVRRDVGLQLSGHTHGGQFWPWNWVIYLIQPVVAGLARFGRTQVYVNSGTGYWGPPMRLGTRAEVTVLTLRASSSA